MADQECRGILVAPAHVGDIGKLEIAPARYDRRVGDHLNVVIGPVETNENLWPLGIDGAGRRDRVLVPERREDVLRADPEGDESRIGQLDEDPPRTLSRADDFPAARDVPQLLP